MGKNSTIIGFSYKPSQYLGVSSGYKNGYRPKNAVAGGNGTYHLSEPPKVGVRFKTGEIIQDFNVYDVIKRNSRRRVTEKYVKNIMSTLVGAQVVGEPKEAISQLIAHRTRDVQKISA